MHAQRVNVIVWKPISIYLLMIPERVRSLQFPAIDIHTSVSTSDPFNFWLVIHTSELTSDPRSPCLTKASSSSHEQREANADV